MASRPSMAQKSMQTGGRGAARADSCSQQGSGHSMAAGAWKYPVTMGQDIH